MLSKLYKDPFLEVRPVIWRNNAAGVVPPKPAKTEAADDTGQLRTRILELTAAVEPQRRQAYETGYRAAETTVRQDLESGVRETVEKLTATIADIASTRGDTIRRAEADTVRLAIEIARRVLHRELTIDTSALEALIKAALQKLQSQEVYRVRVHPDQEKVVRNCLDQMGRSPAVEVVNDPLQPRGGAVFEIGRGSLDASVDTQLREIERGLIDQLEARV